MYKIVSLTESELYFPDWSNISTVIRSSQGDTGVYIVNVSDYLYVIKHSENPISEFINHHLIQLLGLESIATRFASADEVASIRSNAVFNSRVFALNESIESKLETSSDDSSNASGGKQPLNLSAINHFLVMPFQEGVTFKEYISPLLNPFDGFKASKEKLIKDLGQLLVIDLWVRNYDRFDLSSLAELLFFEFGKDDVNEKEFLWGNFGNYMIYENQLMTLDTITTFHFHEAKMTEEEIQAHLDLYINRLKPILNSPKELAEKVGHSMGFSPLYIHVLSLNSESWNNRSSTVIESSNKQNLLSRGETLELLKNGIELMINKIKEFDLGGFFDTIEEEIPFELLGDQQKEYYKKLKKYLQESKNECFYNTPSY